MMGFIKKIFRIFSSPPQFVVESRDGCADRWGEVQALKLADGNGFSSMFNATVYDIIWDDGVVEMGVPTSQFQWDGYLYVRHKSC